MLRLCTFILHLAVPGLVLKAPVRNVIERKPLLTPFVNVQRKRSRVLEVDNRLKITDKDILRISSLRSIIHLMSNVACSAKFVELNCGIFIRLLPFVTKCLILSFCFD